jgi:hypothetical protein
VQASAVMTTQAGMQKALLVMVLEAPMIETDLGWRSAAHFFLDIAGHLAYECMTLGHNLTFIRFFAAIRHK